MVEYENGDPDRPIIVGSVYNGNNTVPMNLPAQKNSSGILTKSTPNSHGYNFLLFNDTAGSEVVKLRCQRDLMFKALRNEQRDIGADQTENIGGNETINVGPVDPSGGQVGAPGGGNFTLNAFQSITLNVGPSGLPLTQIKMDQQSITLSVGPEGILSQIKMDASGVTISSMGGLSQVMVQPSAVTTMSPSVTIGYGPVTFASPSVTIPNAEIAVATIGAGTASGMPLA